MNNPVKAVRTIVVNEKVAVASTLAGVLVWWVFIGRKKYGAKGVNRYA